MQRISFEHTGTDRIFLSRDDVEDQEPGIYVATVHGYGPRNRYRLTIERSYVARAPPEEERKVLKAIHEKCCGFEDSCWLLESLSEDEYKTFCHMPDQICDKEGHIVALRLPLEDLECELPVEIANLTHLSRLDLGDNYVHGNLSHVFSVVKDLPLESLHLGLNNLEGNAACLPAESTLVKHLAFLDVSRNYLDGKLPACIFDSQVLEIAWLKDNSFVGKFPERLPFAVALRHVDLSSQEDLYGDLPDFSVWPNLEHLDLSSNDLAGSFPVLPPSLKNLCLNSNLFAAFLPMDLAQKLPKLEELGLEENKFRGELPADLPSNIISLQLSDNRFTGPIPWSSWLASPEDVKLQELYLSNNKLTGSIPAALARLPNLRAVILTENSIRGGLAEFAEAIPEGNKIVQFEVGHNLLTGALPDAMTKLSMISNFSEANSDYMHPAFDVEHNQLNGTFPVKLTLASAKQWDEEHWLFDISGNRFTCPDAFLGLNEELGYVEELLEEMECYDRRGNLISLGDDQERHRSNTEQRSVSEALMERWSGSPLLREPEDGNANESKFEALFELSAESFQLSNETP